MKLLLNTLARYLLACISIATLSLSAKADVPSNYRLVFNRPAANWNEALPLGNGRIGAMVFGGVRDERLQINEATLWGGSPHDYTNPEAFGALDDVRKLIFAGKVNDAEKLIESKMMGN
ncbi:MAG TPA: glycoside hydrolase N-terminal domain-containing protein, partial [Steroidobacteraceae bacterium]|nr:glycoside hydrolase N-terminal domain-containing protein [Steroidobacteraceae bacterium]